MVQHGSNSMKNIRKKLRSQGIAESQSAWMEASYSCWPVFVMPLNLRPSEIMKRKNIFLTLIIPGTKYTGKNMDVYMQPLKEELQQALDEGFKTYNATSKKTFTMHVW